MLHASPTSPVTVVKLGGAEGIDTPAFCADAASLFKSGRRLVIVHGGSHQTNMLQEQLGHPAQFITSPSGHTSRRTDRRTLEIFQMACRGVLNQQIVENLQRLGVNAVGLEPGPQFSGEVCRGWRNASPTSPVRKLKLQTET